MQKTEQRTAAQGQKGRFAPRGARKNLLNEQTSPEIADAVRERGLVRVQPRAEGARNNTQCDSLLIGDRCGAHTVPYIEVRNPSARVEHEATTSKIGEDQIGRAHV